MKQIHINNILLSPEKTMTLLTMGIEDSCILCYTKQESDKGISWEVLSHHQFKKSLYNPFLIPAWTYEEIRVMIGSSMAAGYVDIPYNFHPNIDGVELRFCVNELSGQKPFKSGVEALGEVLIKMIDKEVVTVEECNKRYEKIFKPK